jgi:hypothetical protein
MIVLGWKPQKRNVVFSEKPDWIDPWVYQQAQVAKKNYNEHWEFWVWQVSKEFNCSIAMAEDACIRGIQKEINRLKLIYGDRVGQWFEEFLDMGDIFRKVLHPDYLPKLGN